MCKRQGQAFLCDQLGGQERANCYAQQLSLEQVQRGSQGTQDREATTTHLARGLAGGSEKVAGGLRWNMPLFFITTSSHSVGDMVDFLHALKN